MIVDVADDDPNWDTMLATFPNATVFQRSAWQHALRDAYGYRGVNTVLESDGRPVAMLPLMEIRSALSGRRAVSLPFTDECAGIGQGAAVNELFKAAVAKGQQRKWKYLEFRGRSPVLGEARSSITFYGHRIDLREKHANAVDGIGSAHRRSVRKAESSGVTIERSSSLDALKEFYALVRRTRQRHGIPPQPWKWYLALHRHVVRQNLGHVFIARLKRIPIAGAIFVESNDTVSYKYGASDDRFFSARPNNLVMWSAIQDFASKGFKSMELGRTALRNDGLRRFKLGWGAQETQISYFKYDLHTLQFTTQSDESTGWHTRVFHLLPRPVAQLIGNLIYKHIG